jgi:DNA primase
VLALPQGKDPDELVRSQPDAWPLAVDSARPVVDHLIAVVSAGLDLTQPLDRSKLVTEVLPAIGEVVDPVLRAHYLQRLSRLARVSEDALRRELPRRSRARATTSENAATQVVTIRAPAGVPKAREEFCLALLYRAPELRRLGEGISESLFGLSENRELFRRWRDDLPVHEDESELWEHYQAILSTRIPFDEMGQLEKALLDCVERLQRGTIRAVKEASALALAEGETGVRPGRVASIARARMGAGIAEETGEDGQAEAVASQLLEDMEAGLRFHRRLIEGSRPDQDSAHAAE